MLRFPRVLLLAVALLALFAGSARAQTPKPIPVTGNLGTITGGPQPDSYVQLTLINCSSGNPQITGYQGIVKTSYRFVADVNGNVNGTVWPNDLIDCNSTTGATLYSRQIVSEDIPVGTSLCYQVTSTQGVWNLQTQQAVSCGASPPNPMDGTYNNLNVNGIFNVKGGFTFGGASQTYQQDGTYNAFALQNPSSSNNGIAMSMAQCLTLPYACRVLAPTVYATTEIPAWEFYNWTNGGYLQYGSLAAASLQDQRFGGSFSSALNPIQMNPYEGGAANVVWGSSYGNATASQASVGYAFSATQTTSPLSGGPCLSQLYDNISQCYLYTLASNAHRYTSEGSSPFLVRSYASSPGDQVWQLGGLFGPAGWQHPFDEGQEMYSFVNTETINVYRGTVSAVSGSTVTVTPATPGAGSGEIIAGTQGDGRYLTDTTSADIVTATPTAVVANVPGQLASPAAGSTYGYFGYMTFSSIPTSSAWGTFSTAVTYPYGSKTVTFSSSGGTLASGLICVADEKVSGPAVGNFEMVNGTVSGSSVTATFHKSHPVGAVYAQGGYCGKLVEIVADTFPSGTFWSNGENSGTTTYPVRYLWPIVGSPDGATLWVFNAGPWQATPSYAGFGTTWPLATNKAVNFYNGAEVLSVAGANGDVSDNKFTLGANAANFTTSMTVQETHPARQSVNGGQITFSQFSPGGFEHGPFYNFTGRMQTAYGGVNVNNQAAWASYADGGGTWILPRAGFYGEGPWQYGLFMNDNTTLESLIGEAAATAVNNTEQHIVQMDHSQVATGDYISYVYNDTSIGGSAWDFFLRGNTSPIMRVTPGGILGTFAGQVNSNYVNVSTGAFSGYMQNWVADSNNFSGTAWQCTSGSPTVTAGQTDQWGGTTATEFHFASAGAFQCENNSSLVSGGGTPLTGSTTYSSKLSAEGAVGDEVIIVGFANHSSVANLSTSWADYTSTGSSGTTFPQFLFLMGGTAYAGETFYVRNAVTVQGSSPTSVLVTGDAQQITSVPATNLPAGTTYNSIPPGQPGGFAVAPLAGTTASIGGSAITAGNCSTGTATIAGAATTMTAQATPATYPGAPFFWNAYVSGSNTVTVSVCTNFATGGTPTASTYNVRVLQ
jgi:hypothetical protein